MPDQIFSPSSVEEARALLTGGAPPFDSPTQRRLRAAEHVDAVLDAGRRRPEWVWALRHDGVVEGVVAMLASPSGEPQVLDHFNLPDDPGRAAALVAHASEAARALGCHEAGIFAPPGSSLDSPQVRPLGDALLAAGWRLLVGRHHYEFEPDPGLAADLLCELTLEQLTDVDDPRLAAVHREVMRETLDAHDAEAVERLGFEAGCAESLGYLLQDPPECIRLALDADGVPVAMVSTLTTPTHRGFLLFVGVAHDHRGRGYGRQLLAAATRLLIADGAQVLIADTDESNVPMARAFADVGWPVTETRIDLVPR